MNHILHKFNLLTLILFIPFHSAFSQSNKLNNYDINLINELGFDAELISKIRDLTDSTFIKTAERANSYGHFRDSLNFVSFRNKGIVGLKISENKNKSLSIVKKLRDEFNSKGYYIYISDSNFGYSPDTIKVIKTDDKFDLLRFEGTHGLNYNLYVEDIIDKISAWDKIYGLKIIGVGSDFIEANFETLPDNIGKYAKELYDFCPDVVDQGTGSIGALKKELARTNVLFLWWD